MRTDEIVIEETYVLNCHKCCSPFDGLESVWCTCLTDECSLVCPSCFHCFCTAPKSYKDKFWEQAPQSIWDGKIENEKSIPFKSNGKPEHVVRPLLLVVDDTLGVLTTAMRAIEGLGYGSILARDGVEGLALSKQYKPDLILSDILIPKMDGLEFCRLVKTDPETRKVSFILMTSMYSRGMQKTEIFKVVHADDYVKKPLELSQLSELLQKHLTVNGRWLPNPFENTENSVTHVESTKPLFKTRALNRTSVPKIRDRFRTGSL